jgi:spore coat polysaccharide biosynthesis protein SpsF
MGGKELEHSDKIVCIIEARMSSSRLPGKVMEKIGNRNSLEHIVHRIRNVEAIDNICIATSTNTEDDKIEKLSRIMGVDCYRGSEEDVLERVLECALFFGATVIVEITGDCPFVDADLTEQYLQIFLQNDLDYLSNNIFPSYPDGFDIQIFRTEALKLSNVHALSQAEREHVTMHIKNNPDLFKVVNIVAPKKYRFPNLSVTLDTREDLEVLRILESKLDDKELNSYQGITSFLISNPSISSINQHIVRKGYATE